MKHRKGVAMKVKKKSRSNTPDCSSAVLYFHEGKLILGSSSFHGKIGPRLERGNGMPDLEVEPDSPEKAIDLLKKWDQWIKVDRWNSS